MRDITNGAESLINAVSYIAAYYDLSFSKELLVAGIPFPDGQLHFSQLSSASKNLGLDVDWIEFNIEQLIALSVPFIMKGESEQYFAVASLNATSASCLTANGVVEIATEVLVKLNSGNVAVFKVEPKVEQRAVTEQASGWRTHWFWGPILKTRHIYYDVFLASVLINLFALTTPLFTMNVYDRVVPNLAFDSLWVLAVGAVLVFIFDFAMKLMRNWFIDLAGKKTDILMSAVIYARTLGMQLQHRPESVGVYSRHLQEFESIRSFLASTTITSLIDFPFAVVMLLVLSMIAGPLVIIPVIAMAVVALVSVLIQTPLNKTIDEANQMSAQKNANLYESLQGIETVKLHGAEGQFQFKWEQAVSHMATWGNKTRWLSNSMVSFAGFSQQLVSIGLIVYGVYLLADNAISMGAIIAAVMLSGRCLQPMLQFAGLATRYSQVIASYQQLDKVMNTPQEQERKRKYLEANELRGKVEFRNVSFRYHSTAEPTLSNVSFKIERGEKVAIIGRIGAGKTTLEKLLLNLYRPDSGVVLLDNINLQQYNPAFVRQHIGVVPQDVQLFYGSIRDNIALGQPCASSLSIQKAAEVSGVSLFTSHDAEGLERQVGEGGRYLSGGQRQSVALARAFLKPLSLYVLDEPTSQMDTRTENYVKQHLANLSNEQTLLLVTHKTTMLDVVDRIIVLEQGKVLMDGPRQAVLDALSEGRIRQPGRQYAA